MKITIWVFNNSNGSRFFLEIRLLSSCYCHACFAYVINNESNYSFMWNTLLICSDLPCCAPTHVYYIK